MAVNKVIYGGNTLIDLTGDSVTKDKLLVGVSAHTMAGVKIDGECTFDADTSDATAVSSEVLNGSIYYARGSKGTGTMPNIGAQNEDIDNVDDQVIIQQGYHDGSGKIKIADVEKKKILPANIKQGVSILGVVGTLEPSSSVTAQSKTVTPTSEKQTIIPDSTYDYLSQVVVNAIPYVETANAAGGTTVTIAG